MIEMIGWAGERLWIVLLTLCALSGCRLLLHLFGVWRLK